MSALLIVIPWSLYWAAAVGLVHSASLTRPTKALRPLRLRPAPLLAVARRLAVARLCALARL
jgi:hypothetical protein